MSLTTRFDSRVRGLNLVIPGFALSNAVTYVLLLK
jgi:hypothetical protein